MLSNSSVPHCIGWRNGLRDTTPGKPFFPNNLRQYVRHVMHPVFHGRIHEFDDGDPLEVDVLHRTSASAGVFRLVFLSAEIEITRGGNVRAGANSRDLTAQIVLLQTFIQVGNNDR